MGQLAAKLPGARQNARKWPRSNVPGGRVEGELPEINLSDSTASSLPLLMPTSPERPENAGQEPKRREEIGFSRGGLPAGAETFRESKDGPARGNIARIRAG